MLLVTGANGQLGQELRKRLVKSEAIFTTSTELDLADHASINQISERRDLTGIINCGAFTAVDAAEDDRIKAHAVNATALSQLGRIGRELNIPVIHVSTDYVFDGKNHRPYIESDPTSPVNYYGATKLLGEKALLAETDLCAIVRTSWVYSRQGKNFVQTMLKLGESRPSLNVIFDQIGTPTYAADLAQTLITVARNLKPGLPKIFHYSNEGVASWYDFAKAIFEIQGMPTKVSPILSKDYPTRAGRPHYSVLDKSLIKSTFDIEIPHWRESLQKCLKQS